MKNVWQQWEGLLQDRRKQSLEKIVDQPQWLLNFALEEIVMEVLSASSSEFL